MFFYYYSLLAVIVFRVSFPNMKRTRYSTEDLTLSSINQKIGEQLLRLHRLVLEKVLTLNIMMNHWIQEQYVRTYTVRATEASKYEIHLVYVTSAPSPSQNRTHLAYKFSFLHFLFLFVFVRSAALLLFPLQFSIFFFAVFYISTLLQNLV